MYHLDFLKILYDSEDVTNYAVVATRKFIDVLETCILSFILYIKINSTMAAKAIVQLHLFSGVSQLPIVLQKSIFYVVSFHVILLPCEAYLI